MSRLLISIIFLLATVAAPGAPDDIVTESDTPQKNQEFTEAELATLRAAEEEYEDNPAITDLINRVKENYGISDEAPAPAPPVPAFKGSLSEAESAYRNKDYETAITHYEALAKDGDGEASLILGTMYELGLGTEPDPATAQAWFRKAAENGSQQGQEIMDLYRLQPMSDEEQKLADQRFAEINQKEDEVREPTVDNKNQDSTVLKPDLQTSAASLPDETGGRKQPLIKIDKTSSVILSVEKHQPAQHFTMDTAPASGWQPDKYPRTHAPRLGKIFRVQDEHQ